MLLLIDENLPRRLSAWFAERNVDSVHVSRLNLIGASDDAVWAAAQKMEAYVLTRDSDFDARAARARKGGVIRLTMGQAKYEVMLHRLEAVWPDVRQRVASGERVIVV